MTATMSIRRDKKSSAVNKPNAIITDDSPSNIATSVVGSEIPSISDSNQQKVIKNLDAAKHENVVSSVNASHHGITENKNLTFQVGSKISSSASSDSNQQMIVENLDTSKQENVNTTQYNNIESKNVTFQIGSEFPSSSKSSESHQKVIDNSNNLDKIVLTNTSDFLSEILDGIQNKSSVVKARKCPGVVNINIDDSDDCGCDDGATKSNNSCNKYGIQVSHTLKNNNNTQKSRCENETEFNQTTIRKAITPADTSLSNSTNSSEINLQNSKNNDTVQINYVPAQIDECVSWIKESPQKADYISNTILNFDTSSASTNNSTLNSNEHINTAPYLIDEVTQKTKETPPPIVGSTQTQSPDFNISVSSQVASHDIDLNTVEVIKSDVQHEHSSASTNNSTPNSNEHISTAPYFVDEVTQKTKETPPPIVGSTQTQSPDFNISVSSQVASHDIDLNTVEVIKSDVQHEHSSASTDNSTLNSNEHINTAPYLIDEVTQKTKEAPQPIVGSTQTQSPDFNISVSSQVASHDIDLNTVEVIKSDVQHEHSSASTDNSTLNSNEHINTAPYLIDEVTQKTKEAPQPIVGSTQTQSPDFNISVSSQVASHDIDLNTVEVIRSDIQHEHSSSSTDNSTPNSNEHIKETPQLIVESTQTQSPNFNISVSSQIASPDINATRNIQHSPNTTSQNITDTCNTILDFKSGSSEAEASKSSLSEPSQVISPHNTEYNDENTIKSANPKQSNDMQHLGSAHENTSNFLNDVHSYQHSSSSSHSHPNSAIDNSNEHITPEFNKEQQVGEEDVCEL
ncbi:5399_t:CDS:2 [Ambispora gerdemannii]|uniref:5399_t:CDS:1 n=1 Tax=Ambispora gerdemannii TaxID=144530 RepID=A0A9N9FXA2_9GLOM|nr:5399_t:CDS:2 [Ambispora gerdemannii]